ncbi:thermonuclease family protein [Sphingomonas sp. HF-S3]|uniref:Thermonuclease family protein n=1 Tax=Sphingomonas rustica TaxID=3103142 RepID=A0ABV0B5D4_9SPHN
MKRRTFRLLFATTVLVGITLGAFAIPAPPRAPSDAWATDRLTGCRVVDGDTLNCEGERIRLLAIDAPEKAGTCRPGRKCAPGDPVASAASLQAAMRGTLTIERLGQDRYGRTLALVRSSRGDLSCWQLSRRQAVYRKDWDDANRVARLCPDALPAAHR